MAVNYPYTRPAAIPLVDHTLHRTTLNTMRNTTRPTEHGGGTNRTSPEAQIQHFTRPTCDRRAHMVARGTSSDDHEAVQWFTCTILRDEPTTTQKGKRPRTLNALHNCWTSTLTPMQDLPLKHQCVITHTYFAAPTCTHPMKHLRDLRTKYDSAIKAKRDYQEQVDARLRDEVSLIGVHERWQQYAAHSEEPYHTAKHHALTSYLHSATVLSLHTRYLHYLHRLQGYENIWTQHI